MLKKILICAVWAFFAALSIEAQNTGTLNGVVVDSADAVVPGATVKVSSPAIPTPRTTSADSNGSFTFLGLPPGIYKIEVEMSGFAPFEKDLLDVRTGATLTYNPQLNAAGVSAAVQVEGSSSTPVIDTTNPERSLNITGDFMNRLPLDSRQSWNQVWTLLPGVALIPGLDPDPNVHGSSERQNTSQFSGLTINNEFSNRNAGADFSTEVIQDIQVKTSGADASTPLGSGGQLNIATKSGGNRFSGSAALFYQPRKFNWTNLPGGTSPDQQLIQPDVSLGGPIIKNKTWFFLSYRRNQIDTGIARTAETLQRFRDNGFEPPIFDRLERNNRFFGKITHQINDRNTIDFTYLNDRGQIFNSDSRTFGTVDTTIDIKSGGPAYQVSWNSNVTSKLFFKAAYGYRVSDSTVSAKGGDNPTVNRFASTVISGGLPSGRTLILTYGNRDGVASSSVGERKRQEFNFDGVYVLGDHRIESGIEWKPKTSAFSENVYAAPYVLVNEVRRVVNGQTVYTPFFRRSINPSVLSGFDLSNSNLGFYVQDKWNANRQLTFTYGVRLDRQQAHEGEIKRLDTWSIGPRFGVNFSLGKQNQNVFRFSAGLLHNVFYNQALPQITPSQARTFINEWDTDLNGTFDTVTRQVYGGASAGSPPADFRISPDLRAERIEEIQAGYTRQLPYRIVFDFGYVKRRFTGGVIQDYDLNAIYSNGLFEGYQFPDFYGYTQYRNNTDSWKDYQAYEFSLIRNFSGKLQAFASYTYQKLVEDGNFRRDQPEFYMYPQSWFKNDKLAIPHILRLNASYYLPWRFTVAGTFSLQSGAYGGALIKDLDYDDPEIGRFGPPEINGFPNPLYSSSRLVGPRSEGQLQLDAVPLLNIRVGKEFRFGEKQSLEFGVDFYNVTNDNTPLFFYNGNYVSYDDFGQKFAEYVQPPRAAQLMVRYRF